MSRPKLNRIEEQLKAGAEFTLTEEQYLTMTGTGIPIDNSYLKNRSAVARLAEKYNYHIVVKKVPKIVKYERLVSFEKEK